MLSFAGKGIFLTLHGKGLQAGRAVVFCRFAGCVLWSGREADRREAVCRFCDTDFVGTDGTNGGRYGPSGQLADGIEAEWIGGRADRLCVLTGGEPTLQVDTPLFDALHERGFLIAVETNGTLPAPGGDRSGMRQPEVVRSPRDRPRQRTEACLSADRCTSRALRGSRVRELPPPSDGGPEAIANTRVAMAYCLRHPQWRLSVQTHKHVGIR